MAMTSRPKSVPTSWSSVPISWSARSKPVVATVAIPTVASTEKRLAARAVRSSGERPTVSEQAGESAEPEADREDVDRLDRDAERDVRPRGRVAQEHVDHERGPGTERYESERESIRGTSRDEDDAQAGDQERHRPFQDRRAERCAEDLVQRDARIGELDGDHGGRAGRRRQPGEWEDSAAEDVRRRDDDEPERGAAHDSDETDEEEPAPEDGSR